MIKNLKFAPNLIPLILNGQKTVTWRLWDDKDLKTGDTINLLEQQTGNFFASAKIIKVSQKPMGQLTDIEKNGHEKYNSDQEMYQTYTNYYKKEVGPETLVKIIHFELLNK